MSQKIMMCSHCGTIVEGIAGEVIPMCCGEKMKVLEPNTTDAAVEKHVPVVTVDGNKVHVSVSSAAHPMTQEHYIQWITLVTDKGTQRKLLTAESAPEADFALTDGEKIIEAYSYCNLHGLWKGC
ncbi:MAG: desulfoferrodoxin family protein [Huintestinicola sp.]